MKFKDPSNVSEEEAKAYFFSKQRVRGGWKCLGCNNHAATVQRQYTMYVNDINNWTCLCEKCAEENYEMWKDRWEEYYGMIR